MSQKCVLVTHSHCWGGACSQYCPKFLGGVAIIKYKLILLESLNEFSWVAGAVFAF